jgi:orotate phosphoribosyltransferase
MELFISTSRLLIEHHGLHLDAIAGGETAGIPFASYLASALGKPMVYIRKKPKNYGLASQVEGYLKPGSKVLLVEDLITDGGSKRGFLKALEAVETEAHHALVLFDRQQGGTALLAEHGVTLHTVVNRSTALAVGEAEGQVTSSARESVEQYFKDPATWHRERGLLFSP